MSTLTVPHKASPASRSHPDTIHIDSLQLPPQRFRHLNDLWNRSGDISPQPATVTLAIHANLSSTALTDGRDSLAGTVNYGTASKAVLAVASSSKAQTQGWDGIEHLAETIADELIARQGAPSVKVKVALPRALLACDALEYEAEWQSPSPSPSPSPIKHTLVKAPQYHIRGLRLNALIGLNACERKELQPIVVTLRLMVDGGAQDYCPCWNPRELISDLSSYIVKATQYGTVETLSTEIARLCFSHTSLLNDRYSTPSRERPTINRIAVRVDKPSAVSLASCAGAEVVRDRSYFNQRPYSLPTPSFFQPARIIPTVAAGQGPHWWTAFLSLGSNLGARSATIHSALRLLEAARRVAGLTGREQWAFQSSEDGSEKGQVCYVADTSLMYETAPMYVEDQPRFLNAAAEIRTCLSPLDLLDLTQAVEAHLGRDHAASRASPKGPRVVDLDIIWHDGAYAHPDLFPKTADSDSASSTPPPKAILHTDRLTLPHIGLAEREFVLRPLADMRPGWRHPVDGRSVLEMLSALTPDPGMHRVLPITFPSPKGGPSSERTLVIPSKTYIMSIMNATPDSFSDGGQLGDDVEAAVRTARDMLAAGADILDIGGMSTAPGRPDVDEAEEAARVVPIVQGIRRAEATLSDGGQPAIISIDTFRPSVAQHALDAGASLINDVTGARGNWSDDPAANGQAGADHNALGDEMLRLVAQRGVPIVLMHMRGTSRTMTSSTNTSYGQVSNGKVASEDDAVVYGVREELRICVERALLAGVPRWNIILDPGIGFAKTREGSLALVRRVGDLTSPAHEEADVRRAVEGGGGEGPSREPNLSLRNLPILLGPSRKRFLAPTTSYRSHGSSAAAKGSMNGSVADGSPAAQPDPRDRVFSTAAACAAGVAGGVDIVRVHDTKEMLDVVRTADAIWRPNSSSRLATNNE